MAGQQDRTDLSVKIDEILDDLDEVIEEMDEEIKTRGRRHTIKIFRWRTFLEDTAAEIEFLSD